MKDSALRLGLTFAAGFLVSQRRHLNVPTDACAALIALAVLVPAQPAVASDYDAARRACDTADGSLRDVELRPCSLPPVRPAKYYLPHGALTLAVTIPRHSRPLVQRLKVAFRWALRTVLRVDDPNAWFENSV